MKQRRGYKVAAMYVKYREKAARCAKRKNTSCHQCRSRAKCGDFLLYYESDKDLTTMNKEFVGRDE